MYLQETTTFPPPFSAAASIALLITCALLVLALSATAPKVRILIMVDSNKFIFCILKMRGHDDRAPSCYYYLVIEYGLSVAFNPLLLLGLEVMSNSIVAPLTSWSCVK